MIGGAWCCGKVEFFLDLGFPSPNRSSPAAGVMVIWLFDELMNCELGTSGDGYALRAWPKSLAPSLQANTCLALPHLNPLPIGFRTCVWRLVLFYRNKSSPGHSGGRRRGHGPYLNITVTVC
ncbi:hypothetical protein ACO22_00076 [Paracoccidioides brasiliensis]|uniref:Uncharacterized protein n=1 Tax=Paracoccidioides brasiliensis TaxID=121759 RepID=A0A1D2JQ89_PARBR|nr:hypothetical protein ACO22_00076 [Paracoccidioides brasiliensis]